MLHEEIEVRFLEIDPELIKMRLKKLGADDHGESLLEEIIFYDKELQWHDSTGKFVRLRKSASEISLSYKDHQVAAVNGTEEIEFNVSNMDKAQAFLERIGLVAYRHQQKRRHSFVLGNVIVDIDTWPRIPTYLEIEGPSEGSLKEAASKLGLNWDEAVFENARMIIENRYHIPVGNMQWFTFDKFE